MLLDDIYVVSDTRALATDAQIMEAEAALGRRLPDGYRGFMTMLGAGEFNDSLRVLPPPTRWCPARGTSGASRRT